MIKDDEIWRWWTSGFLPAKHPDLANLYKKATLTDLPKFLRQNFSESNLEEISKEFALASPTSFTGLGSLGSVEKKAGIIAELASQCKISKAEAKNIVNKYWDIIVKKLAKSGDTIILPNVGSFKITTAAARSGQIKNPQTGKVKTYSTPERMKVKFTQSATMKKILNDDKFELKEHKVKAKPATKTASEKKLDAAKRYLKNAKDNLKKYKKAKDAAGIKRAEKSVKKYSKLVEKLSK